jgi:hypothetical protein
MHREKGEPADHGTWIVYAGRRVGLQARAEAARDELRAGQDGMSRLLATAMKISAKLTALFSILFATVCSGFAITGFTSLGGITDPVQASDAEGFAWFWSFLASVSVVFGFLSWRMARTPRDQEDA